MKISDAQIDNLVGLLDGYAEKGGHHLNVNVFTKETLLDAQQPVLDFLNAAEECRVSVIIRHVIVKGYTDTPEEWDGIGKLIAQHRNIKGLEVLPYHNMGEAKYKELGLSYPLKGMENLPKELAQTARQEILKSVRKYREQKTL